MSDYEIVKVLWEDSASAAGWRDRNDTSHGLASCESVGYLVRLSPTEVVIAQSVSPDEIADLLCVPMSCVRSMTTLQPRDETSLATREEP